MERSDTYRVVTLGIMVPLVIVSTSKTNGIIDRMLWCDENGMYQCTTRLWAQTRSTRALIGKIHSIRIRMECVKLAKLACDALFC